MFEGLMQAVALCVAIGSAALLVYGGWLVWLFQHNASLFHKRTVARLALHESLTPNQSLEELKVAALGLSHRAPKPIHLPMRPATPADQLAQVFDATTPFELAAGDVDTFVVASCRADKLESSQHSAVAIAKERAPVAGERVA
jgi:hypothetical protein